MKFPIEKRILNNFKDLELIKLKDILIEQIGFQIPGSPKLKIMILNFGIEI